MSTQDSGEISSSELRLPPGFEKIEDIMNMPNERLQKNPLVNVIGLVKDYQPPIPTKGTGMQTSAPYHVIRLLTASQISSLLFPS